MLLCTTLSLAQTPPPDAPLQPIKIATPTRIVGNAKVYYIEIVNQTMVETALQVIGSQSNGLTMKLSFHVQGKKVVTPNLISLEFISISNEMKYTDDRNLTMWLDDVGISFGELVLTTSQQASADLGVQYMLQSIPYDKFLRLLDAKEVKVRLGPTEFKLKSKHLEALRDLQRSIEQ